LIDLVGVVVGIVVGVILLIGVSVIALIVIFKNERENKQKFQSTKLTRK
jgi:FtsZ-interacting cell division protein ZipA